MESLMQTDEDGRIPSTLPGQALVFLMHIALGLGSWLALMMVGYALNPQGIPQVMILLLSILVPLVVGYGVTHLRQDEMAPLVWLIGLIWILIVSLWVLDMPTAPSQCFQCDATEKLTRTFFSIPKPSGLIDDDGPFIGTWPAAALLGYSIGAWLAIRHSRSTE